MKTLSLKILGGAAVFALLTITRAQTSDDVQTVPPPDTNVAPDTTPNVIVVPMAPTDINADAAPDGAPPDGGPNTQPGQNIQPNQFRGPGGNQFQQGRNNRRGNRGDFNQQRFTSVGSNSNVLQPPAGSGTNGTDGLILNFRGASIDQVLTYLSDAAGFIIELDVRVSGTVDVFSAHPVSKDEAVQLLNSVLNKNGYAAVRSGRTLHIMSKDAAIRGQIPVIVEGDPDKIPVNDEIVTQIIPIRYVSARQLIIDLSSLTQSPSIIANDAGNSIIVTDTQANIHHLAELVKAIDGSAEDVTVLKPFHLRYHDPVEVANLISSIFADQSGQGATTPLQFGGFGGFGGGRGGGFGGRGGGGGGLAQLFGGGGGGRGAAGQQGNSQNDRMRQRAKVIAVADQRTGTVLVTAPKDIMSQVEELVAQVDHEESPKVAHVSVIHLENADPTQVQKVLQQFQGNNSRTATTTQTSPLTQRANQTTTSGTTGFGTTTGGGGFGGGGGGGNFGGGRGGGGGGLGN